MGRRRHLLGGLRGQQLTNLRYEIEIDLGDDQTMKARAEWKRETLELRTDLGGGFSINQSYSLDSETGRMEIDISSRVRGRRIQTIQVYDRTSR